MAPSRSPRRLLAWSLGDILPDSEAGWRGVATVCLGLSPIVGLVVAGFGYLVSPFVLGEHREGGVSPLGLAFAVLVYGLFMAGPMLGWIFAAQSRFRLAIAAAVAPTALYAVLGAVAVLSR